MEYVSLYELMPELAENETRTIIKTGNHGNLPIGEYGLVEMFCNTPGCDCRRVMFNVVDWKNGQCLAVVNYGWENRGFYIEWFGEDEKDYIDELKGPCLNMMSPQSKYATEILDVIKSITLTDQSYVERLKRHYKLFKKIVDARKTCENNVIFLKENNISRNEPCPCGSGKKYKNCCLN